MNPRSTRVLILGAGGMLGHKLAQHLGRQFECWATIRGRAADYAKFGIYDASLP